MEWLSQNWGWIVLAAAFLGMHFFGHRGHGGGGGCCGGGHGAGDKPGKGEGLPSKDVVDGKAGHQH